MRFFANAENESEENSDEEERNSSAAPKFGHSQYADSKVTTIKGSVNLSANAYIQDYKPLDTFDKLEHPF